MAKIAKVQEVDVSRLVPYERNAKVHGTDQIEKLCKSIEEFGFISPCLIDKQYNVIAGHGRIMAAKELGMEKVPCLFVDGLTDEQRRAYILADNRLTELGEWDMGLVESELSELQIDGFDISLTGFDLDIGEIEPDSVAEDDVPEPPKEAKSKLGQIYQLGEHRLMCGDSTDEYAVSKLMDNDTADMVLTDPPYGMYLDTDFSTIKGSLKSIGRKNRTSGNKYDAVIGDNDDFTEELISTIFNCCDCDEMFLFGADYYAELLPDKNNGSWLVWDKRKESQADAIGSEFELIWSRNKHKRRMLRHDWFGFLSSENQADARNRVHPTQKPVSLLVDIINQWGQGKNNIVDLYGGSGSTLIACEQTGRKCYMMELDPHYVDVIIERWENLTGKKAVLLT